MLHYFKKSSARSNTVCLYTACPLTTTVFLLVSNTDVLHVSLISRNQCLRLWLHTVRKERATGELKIRWHAGIQRVSRYCRWCVSLSVSLRGALWKRKMFLCRRGDSRSNRGRWRGRNTPLQVKKSRNEFSRQKLRSVVMKQLLNCESPWCWPRSHQLMKSRQ